MLYVPLCTGLNISCVFPVLFITCTDAGSQYAELLMEENKEVRVSATPQKDYTSSFKTKRPGIKDLLLFPGILQFSPNSIRFGGLRQGGYFHEPWYEYHTSKHHSTLVF
jgi:hypothetical protein